MIIPVISLLMLSINKPWWDSAVETSLNRLPAQKPAWVQMLAKAPLSARAELTYLVRYLPLRDLKSLPPAQLKENVLLALRAQAAVNWQIPRAIFREAVLPYVCVTEPRDSMRAEFMAKYLLAVKPFSTPGEAALYLNRTLFADTKVVYNTKRRTTDQTPRDSIAQGMATCTGLSIMLVDACRAVGVPARIAGIYAWPGRGGNHTWVEVWDNGWHFLGAAEPDDRGLDHGWFLDDASKAIKSKPENSIFAVTYKPTGVHFPLEWAPNEKVNAENVTDRYVHALPVPPRIMVEVSEDNVRVEAKVVIRDAATGRNILAGNSCGPHADNNHFLSTPVAIGSDLLITAVIGNKSETRKVKVGEDTVVRFDMDNVAILLADRFGSDAVKRERAATRLEKKEPNSNLKAMAWTAYKSSPIHKGLREEFERNVVSTAARTSPYLWRKVGTEPKNGWALVIAMHGGGGVPKEENDSQWNGMFRYYNDHPEAGGYIYLALRAPNDEWNGFYDDAISPLIERLIKQFVLFANVDSQRVYALGASHGGYGAFVIGPKIPYRFAAVHASAAAQTPNETMGENLRNLQFSWMVGENDRDYQRAELAQKFAEQVKGWRTEYGGYPGGLELLKNTGHFIADHDKLAAMRQFFRESFPKHLVWSLSDDVLKDFYWIHNPKPQAKAHLEAIVEGNTIIISGHGVEQVDLRLDSQLLDVNKPVTIRVRGMKDRIVKAVASLETYCSELEDLGDPDLATASVVKGIRLSP